MKKKIDKEHDGTEYDPFYNYFIGFNEYCDILRSIQSRSGYISNIDIDRKIRFRDIVGILADSWF